MQNEVQTNRDSYQFFKEKFNIDFSTLTPKRSRIVIEQINKTLDEKIAEERKKILELTAQISIEHFRITRLSKKIEEKDY